jgi:hypothetical protein
MSPKKAPPEAPSGLPPDLNQGLAFDDDVEADARLALLADRPTGLELDVLDDGGDAVEFLVVHA